MFRILPCQIFTSLVLQFKTSKIIYGMANISIKSQNITPSGVIFHVMERFVRYFGPIIDGELELRCTTFGNQRIKFPGPVIRLFRIFYIFAMS